LALIKKQHYHLKYFSLFHTKKGILQSFAKFHTKENFTVFCQIPHKREFYSLLPNSTQKRFFTVFHQIPHNREFYSIFHQILHTHRREFYRTTPYFTNSLAGTLVVLHEGLDIDSYCYSKISNTGELTRYIFTLMIEIYITEWF